MSNTLHGIRSGYWKRLDLPSWFTTGAIVYCVLFAMIVAFKIPYATNAMLGSPWWSNTSQIIRVASFVDTLFLVFVAAVPMVKALYLVVFDYVVDSFVNPLGRERFSQLPLMSGLAAPSRFLSSTGFLLLWLRFGDIAGRRLR